MFVRSSIFDKYLQLVVRATFDKTHLMSHWLSHTYASGPLAINGVYLTFML